MEALMFILAMIGLISIVIGIICFGLFIQSCVERFEGLPEMTNNSINELYNLTKKLEIRITKLENRK